MRKKKIIIIAGTRPNFVKIIALIRAMKRYPTLQAVLIHTNQHYDYTLSKIFFDELKIPKPDYYLGVGSGSHGYQTGEIMRKLEPILIHERPHAILVVGDVNSTLAGALTAAKLHIPIVHVEAGLRSFDMRMPEEINRVVTDHISDFLFVSEPSGIANLLAEGISRKKIFFVGNTMIDTLLASIPKLRKNSRLKKWRLTQHHYALLTLHRPENVDNKKIFQEIIHAIINLQKRIKIVWPMHPRAEKQLKKLGFWKIVIKTPHLIILPPQGYGDTITLLSNAALVLTDSGGIQEETTVLRVPCLTLRESTERPITIEKGTNQLVALQRKKIVSAGSILLNKKIKKLSPPRYWDGKASGRIINVLRNKL